jgi:ABC-2 type transport system permease protein
VTLALRSYGLLLRWQYLRLRRQLPVIVLIQVVIALGIVYGLALLVPNVDPASALFLATGAPTIALLLLGLTVVPQEVAQDRLTGRAAYLAALPVPRLAPAAAQVTFWLFAQLPGTALALVLAAGRFDFGLRVHPAVLPTIILVALSGASVGFALASVLKPELASHVTSFVAIGILLFSPLNFPAERLPDVLRAIHAVLPIQYMGDLVRWSLTGQGATNVGLAFAVVTAWCLAGIATGWRVSLRRA